MDDLIKIIGVLKTIRIGVVRLESDVVSEIESKFKNAGIEYKTEVKIDQRSRVDILTENGIAIEVKKGKPNTRLVSLQIKKYAESEKVRAIILVSERGLCKHLTESSGKPVEYVSLASNWGVAL